MTFSADSGLEKARVTFALNPSNFNLRFSRDEETFVKLSREAEDAFKGWSRSPEEVRLGDLCLARCPDSDLVGRARVVELYHSKILGPHARVAFLDVGHSRWIQITQIREVSKQVRP